MDWGLSSLQPKLVKSIWDLNVLIIDNWIKEGWDTWGCVSSKPKIFIPHYQSKLVLVLLKIHRAFSDKRLRESHLQDFVRHSTPAELSYWKVVNLNLYIFALAAFYSGCSWDLVMHSTRGFKIYTYLSVPGMMTTKGKFLGEVVVFCKTPTNYIIRHLIDMVIC